MNIIRKIVLSLSIIIRLNLCFGRDYYLKTVVDDMEPALERLHDRAAMWHLLSKIFEYESFVTLNIEQFFVKDATWYNTFIKLLQTNVGLPTTVIETTERSNRTVDLYKMYRYQQNANTSYIFIMDMRIHSIFLEEAKISSIAWDPKANFVVVTVIDGLLQIHNVFRTMWKTHGISKIIAIDIESEHVVAYNCFKEQIKVFNDSDIEQILQYRLPKYGFDRYPLQAAMYENRPTSIDIPNSTKFQGLEQILIDTLEYSLNFSVKMCKITEFPDEEGGAIPVVLEKIGNREIDVAANMHFIMGRKNNPKNGFEYTSPFFTERLHFIVPKAKKIPLWLSMYLVFDTETWISVTCLFVLLVVLWLCIFKFGQKRRIRGYIGSAMINVLFLLGGHSIPVRMTTHSKRLVSVCGSIFAIIMVNCFSGDLFRRFSKDAYYPDVNSFEGLEKSKLHIHSSIWGAAEILNNSIYPSLFKLLEKTNFLSAYNLTNGVLDHAVLTRVTRAKFEEAKSLIENNGTMLFHRFKDPIAVFSMAYIVPRGWAFLNAFNLHINKILEAGLIQKWYYDDLFNHSLWSQKLEYTSLKTVPRAFSLSDLGLAWIVLGVGISISLIVFLVELSLHYLICKCVRRTLPLP